MDGRLVQALHGIDAEAAGLAEQSRLLEAALCVLAAQPGTGVARAAAAECLALAGLAPLASKVAAGEAPRLGSDLARLARRVGRLRWSGRFHEMGQRFLEAAEDYAQAGDWDRVLKAASRLQPGDAAYRAGALMAIDALSAREVIDLAAEEFLSAFIASGPSSEAEARAFERLISLYARLGLQENAAEAAAKLRSYDPQRARLTAPLLGPSATPGGPAAGQALPALPELPPPPVVPPAPRPWLEATRAVTPVAPRVPTPVRGPATPAAASGAFVPGRVIAGRYELGPVIGRGGSSVVFRARDTLVGEEVALKALAYGDLGRGQDADERFRHELRLSRQLTHPNIVRVHDLGAHEGCLFISMELLDGAVLRAFMGAPLDLARACGWLIEVCGALDHAHARGVVHRDIKPENVFVTRGGSLKVVDFGISRWEKAGSAGGVVSGTPRYMPPEQIQDGERVAPASDLYSLGVMAYELLTGGLPFQHADPLMLMAMHLHQPPPEPSSLRGDLPRAVDDLILQLLSKDPAQRPASASQVAERLKQVSWGSGGEAAQRR